MRKEIGKMLRLCLALALIAALAPAGLCRPACAAGWLSALTGAVGAEEEAEEPLAAWPGATPAPDAGIVASTIADDGLLRVYLKSLGAPEALDLTLAGEYTAGHNAGFRFDRGTELTLYAEGGDVLLYVGGLWLNAGESLVLTRQAADEGEENGIYIRQSEKDTLYCGDLTVSAQDGALRAILEIQIEDYLYGVVAYEMSDAFPLEALKAQAIAARTYAMGRKWVSAARDYDLVDTTADQVYKGYDAEYRNVVTAVDATRGVVGTYKGGFAMCYYTASNGGQTALPTDIWSGDGDYGYLDTRDDPYDLENPKSLVNRLCFQADLSDSGEMWSLLTENLALAARAAGMTFDEIRLDRVESIEPILPKREGSRMYERLRFVLRISTREGAWRPDAEFRPLALRPRAAAPETPAVLGLALADRLARGGAYTWTPGEWEPRAETVEIELYVYDQIKDELALGLSGLDCELVSVVTETDDNGDATAFTLEMRRFGHGVGMSQRGAQQMAGQHGMKYPDILGFYYPGMTLERIAWDAPALTPLAELPTGVPALAPQATPRPTPAPLPSLKEGEYYARVALESASSTLNVREAPSTTARVLDAFRAGREVIVMAEAEDGWAHIRTAELEGYVKLEYLQRKED